MEKEEIAELILDMQTPSFKCPIKDCKIDVVDPNDFLEHLNLDHPFEELLDIFDWDIVEGKVVIKNEKTNNHKIGEENLDKFMRVDDTEKERREIATHLVEYFLDCKMIPNEKRTRYYNVMSYSENIATVDCWDLKEDELLWGFIVIHDGGKSTKAKRKVNWLIDNKMEKGRKDRLEIAKEIVRNKNCAC